MWRARNSICLPDLAVDSQVLLRKALGQLELVIVHQCRVRDNDQWGTDAQYLANSPGAWDESSVATKWGSGKREMGAKRTAV